VSEVWRWGLRVRLKLSLELTTKTGIEKQLCRILKS
jgi:hypothetical protein